MTVAQPPSSAQPPSPDAQAPQTDDLVVDAALRELDQVDPVDLEGVLAASEAVLQTLQERLRDIGD